MGRLSAGCRCHPLLLVVSPTALVACPWLHGSLVQGCAGRLGLDRACWCALVIKFVWGWDVVEVSDGVGAFCRRSVSTSTGPTTAASCLCGHAALAPSCGLHSSELPPDVPSILLAHTVLLLSIKDGKSMEVPNGESELSQTPHFDACTHCWTCWHWRRGNEGGGVFYFISPVRWHMCIIIELGWDLKKFVDFF
jgi:hypothetical protein